MSTEEKILFIEPFFGGSHKQLIETIIQDMDPMKYVLITLTAKKWHWRARTSALTISQLIPEKIKFSHIFASSVLNLAELIALRQDLKDVKKILYFHENQLIYPVRKQKDRDFQYGYNQILSCMVADVIIFNSLFNQTSFLNNINKFFKLQPDYRPKNLDKTIAPKCSVLYYPINLTPIIDLKNEIRINLVEKPLHIVWPHRWEHDKNPELLISVLLRLNEIPDINFKISLLGESTNDVPECIKNAKEKLESKILTWGRLEYKRDYFNVLINSDVVISTAIHEFFGVAMLEAVAAGCYPICPKNYVYPELYPSQCLYNSEHELFDILLKFCINPNEPRDTVKNLDLKLYRFDSNVLLSKYKQLFN